MNSKHINGPFVVSTARMPVESTNMIYKQPITEDDMSFLEKVGDTDNEHRYEGIGNSKKKNDIRIRNQCTGNSSF